MESDSFHYSHTMNLNINLTNDVIVSQSASNPSDDYKRVKFLGEGSYAAVYCVENKITGSKRANTAASTSANGSPSKTFLKNLRVRDGRHVKTSGGH